MIDEIKIAKFIANKIGVCLYQKFIKKLKGTIDKKSQEIFLEKYISNLEKMLLYQYGDESFYDGLCKIILKNSDIIINRCFSRDILDEKNNSEFITEIMKNSDKKFIPYDWMYIKNILTQVILITYRTFNEPTEVETRKITNITLKSRDDIISVVRSESASLKDFLKSYIEKNEASMQEICKHIDAVERKMENTKLQLQTLLERDLQVDEITSLKTKDYNIAVCAKDETKCFYVNVEIEIDLHKTPYNSFNELISMLRFRGESAQFKVCYFEIKTYDNKVLTQYKDDTYDGLRIKLPVIYINEYKPSEIDIQNMFVNIQPKFDYLSFAIEDENGSILIPYTDYLVKRNIQSGLLNISLVGKDVTKGLTYIFDIKIKNIIAVNNSSKAIVDTTFNISLAEKSTVSQNIEFLVLLKKLSEARNLFGIEKNTNEIILETNGVNIDSTDILDDYELKIEVYRKLRNIERRLGVSIDIPDEVEVGDVEQINLINDLIIKGISDLKIENVTIPMKSMVPQNQYKIEDILSMNKLNVIFSLKDISIFNTTLPILENTRVFVYSEEIPKIENEMIILKSSKAYIYDKIRKDSDDFIMPHD